MTYLPRMWCQYVGMCIYNVMIMCVLGVAISAVLTHHPNTEFVLISVFIVFATTLTLCLVFVPKVSLHNNSHGQLAAGCWVGESALLDTK